MIKKITSAFAWAVAGLALTSAGAVAAGDAAAGKRVFNRCAACHQIDKERNGVGPHLVNIIGRKAASVEKYRFSSAMKKKGADGLTWTLDNLHAYIENPRKFVPGGRMAFPGINNKQDRDDLFAYIQSREKK